MPSLGAWRESVSPDVFRECKTSETVLNRFSVVLNPWESSDLQMSFFSSCNSSSQWVGTPGGRIKIVEPKWRGREGESVGEKADTTAVECLGSGDWNKLEDFEWTSFEVVHGSSLEFIGGVVGNVSMLELRHTCRTTDMDTMTFVPYLLLIGSSFPARSHTGPNTV